MALRLTVAGERELAAIARLRHDVYAEELGRHALRIAVKDAPTNERIVGVLGRVLAEAEASRPHGLASGHGVE